MAPAVRYSLFQGWSVFCVLLHTAAADFVSLGGFILVSFLGHFCPQSFSCLVFLYKPRTSSPRQLSASPPPLLHPHTSLEHQPIYTMPAVRIAFSRPIDMPQSMQPPPDAPIPYFDITGQRTADIWPQIQGAFSNYPGYIVSGSKHTLFIHLAIDLQPPFFSGYRSFSNSRRPTVFFKSEASVKIHMDVFTHYFTTVAGNRDTESTNARLLRVERENARFRVQMQP